MKKLYEQPELEVIEFEVEDVLSGSPTGDDDDNENMLPVIPA